MSTTTKTTTLINVRTWSGSQTACVTDMTNAGKRGKTCRTVHVSFAGFGQKDEDGYGEWLHAVNTVIPSLDTAETSFDDVMTYLRALAAVAKVELRERTIRGVDAPKPVLMASGPKFAASANEEGISIACLVDHNNLPKGYSRGSAARAYAIAAKVFPTLTPDMGMHAVASALSAAGADMHTYCAMD